jgi:hypothetical protein
LIINQFISRGTHVLIEETTIARTSEPTPSHHQAHLVDSPAPGHAKGQRTGESDEANDVAHWCSPRETSGKHLSGGVDVGHQNLPAAVE